MNNTNNHDEHIVKITFASVYPLYVAKIERKGRSRKELHQIHKWLTNYDEKELQELIEEKATFEKFFQNATSNPNAHLITGKIYIDNNN